MIDDEASVVARAQAGDRASLEVLLREHAPRIHSVCRRITGNDADAADAGQEAMIAIVRGLQRFDGRSAFGTWVYRVTANACLDELRRRGRRPEPVDTSEHDETAHNQPIDVSVANRMDVDDALSQLPFDFRTAVVLRDLCGLEYSEIAETLAIPVGTVRSRIARGRSALVPLLAPASAGPGNRDTTTDRPTR